MESMNFHQTTSTSRVRANTLLSSLPTNIVNEILDIVNQEIKAKISTYRDQMLTYAQEIDEKLSNCKDSRNKYYQICQQLTTKYSKLKKKYEHLYTRYQSYKGRNKELFNLLQFLSAEDIRVQHQILKYQSKYRNSTNHTNSEISPNLNINSININTNLRETSPSISAISSPSYNNTLAKRHSKSKTATSIPFRNSLLVNDPHKILTNQASALSAATKSNNPFSGYNYSYKRCSNSDRSHASHSTMSIHEEHESNDIDSLRLKQRNIYPITLRQHSGTELEGFDDNNTLGKQNEKNMLYSVHTPPVTMRQSNFSPGSEDDIESNNSSQIQPVAMPASLFINNHYHKINSGHLHPIYSPKITVSEIPNKSIRIDINKKDKKYKKSKHSLLANVLRDDHIDESDEYDGMFRKHHLRELNSMIVNASSEDDDEYGHDEEEEDDAHDSHDQDIIHEEQEQVVINCDNQQSNSSTLKQDRNSSNIDYSRSHSSSLLSGYTDDDQTQTQQFYYEQLKLTPVPTKRVVDKNRLIGILRNLPTDSNEDVNRGGSPSNETPNEDVIDVTHHDAHSRHVSSNMSFPDIDKINSSAANNTPHSEDDKSNADDLDERQRERSNGYSEHSNASEIDMVVEMNTGKMSNKTPNVHIRSSTFCSKVLMDKPEKVSKRSKSNNNNSESGKTIKLFYRFGAKSYPPIMVKTTNTIKQLKALIAGCLQNIDPKKLLIAHRQRVLHNMDLTVSQCDISQYDTIIAKIDTTRGLFAEDKEVMVISPHPNSTKSNNSFGFDSTHITPINTKTTVQISKRLWTPDKTPHSVGSLGSAYATPRRSLTINGHAHSNRPHSKKTHRVSAGDLNGYPDVDVDVMQSHDYTRYPSPPMSVKSQHTEPEANEEEKSSQRMSTIADNISHMNNVNARSSLFGVSRPVSRRRKYDETIDYPFSVCPASVAVQSPKFANKQHSSRPNISAVPATIIHHQQVPMSKQLLSPRRMKRRAPRVRFSTDTKYNLHEPNHHNLLELKRNLSRSLDVRMEDTDHDHKAEHNKHNGDDTGSFSPLPSRRRTQKLDHPPLGTLMNTANCKKSKSLSISKKKQQKKKRNRLKTRSFSSKHSNSSPPNTSVLFSRKQSTLVMDSHRGSIRANLSVNSMDDEEEETDDDDVDEIERQVQAMELQRDVSREDLDSGDEISIEQYPNFEDRERRKTIEIGKLPLI